MQFSLYKIAVHIPRGHSDAVREAVGRAGGGNIGEYTFCSFTVEGTGRYKPSANSEPFLGKKEVLNIALEERIEITVDSKVLKSVVQAIRSVHPYEEPTIDIYPLVSEDQL